MTNRMPHDGIIVDPLLLTNIFSLLWKTVWDAVGQCIQMDLRYVAASAGLTIILSCYSRSPTSTLNSSDRSRVGLSRREHRQTHAALRRVERQSSAWREIRRSPQLVINDPRSIDSSAATDWLRGIPLLSQDEWQNIEIYLHCESKNWTLFHFSTTLANTVKF